MLKSVCAGLFFCALASVQGAQAAVVTVTYSGLMEQGTDANNAFGISASPATNVDLANLPVLVTYTFDLSRGLNVTAPGAVSISGGTFNGHPSPALQATIRINSHDYSFAGDALGIIAASNIFASTSHLAQNAQSSAGDSVYSTVDAPLGTFANSILGPLSLDSSKQTFTALTIFSLSNGASGDFYARSVTVSSVPLPATLPLFAISLLGVGAAAAWRRSRLQTQG